MEIDIKSIYGNFIVYIDKIDLPLVASIRGSWYLSIRKGKIEGVYTKIQKNKIRHKVALHRLIMNCTDDMVVDHIDRNTLNNHRKNLRVVTIQVNNTNLSSYSNNASGHTNIYIEQDGKYAVRIKNKRFGRFDTLEEAKNIRDSVIKNIFPFRSNIEVI